MAVFDSVLADDLIVRAVSAELTVTKPVLNSFRWWWWWRLFIERAVSTERNTTEPVLNRSGGGGGDGSVGDVGGVEGGGHRKKLIQRHQYHDTKRKVRLIRFLTNGGHM